MEAITRTSQVLDARQSIITARNVFSPGECDALIAFAEGIGFEEAPITTSHGFMMAKDIRDNTRVMLDDRVRAQDMWQRIKDIVPEQLFLGTWKAVGLNERLRFYRYDPGQLFRWHRDGAFVRPHAPGGLEPIERSHLTLLLYLNEGFEGGETEIDRGEILTIRPERGGALLFAHHARHQGAPVLRGRKYVLRSDVMYRHEPAVT